MELKILKVRIMFSKHPTSILIEELCYLTISVIIVFSHHKKKYMLQHCKPKINEINKSPKMAIVCSNEFGDQSAF